MGVGKIDGLEGLGQCLYKYARYLVSAPGGAEDDFVKHELILLKKVRALSGPILASEAAVYFNSGFLPVAGTISGLGGNFS